MRTTALESIQEKIATDTLPLPHKNMHKIRLNTVFILFRATQICGLDPLL